MVDKKVSIFIPTGNRVASLQRVLYSLEEQSYRNFEVIIVDYKSRDDTKKITDIFRKSLSIVFVEQKEKGLALAANLALKQAKGGIFIRTDDDVKMSNGWLKSIVDTFRDSKVGGVSGPTVIPGPYKKNRDLFVYESKFKNGSWLWKQLGKIYYGWFMDGKPYSVGHWFGSGAFSLGSNYVSATKVPIQEIDNLEACNFAIRTNLLRQIGGFDTIYGGVGEYHEADAAWKVKRLGYKLLFNPDVALFHMPSQDGFFHDRPNSYSRMVNYIVFYLRYIKPTSIKKVLQFISYIIFLWCYYCLTGIKTKNLKQFGAIPGTFAGFIVYFKNPLTS